MSERGVTRTAGVCGGDACIAGTRIMVWLLVDRMLWGQSNDEILAAYPSLTADDLTTAYQYWLDNAYAVAQDRARHSERE